MGLQLIVAGMHRSGTSLTAAFIDAIGISMGDRLLAADRNNQKGYFEDLDFLEFHRTALTAAVRTEEAGVHDWGWTLSEALDPDRFSSFGDDARQLIRTREEKFSAWGWKDPRTTLMLDFWSNLLPDAKFLLVYRSPWDVAESMMRVGGDYFPAHPDHSLSIWSFYNEALLRFYRTNRDRCVLFSISSLIRDPEHLMRVVRDKLGLEIADEGAASRFGNVYSGDLFHALPPEHPVVQLVRHFHPRCVSVLDELEGEADLPGNLLPRDAAPLDPDRLAAWPFFCYRETAEARTKLRKTEKDLQETRSLLEERDGRLWHAESEIRQQSALIEDVKSKASAYWAEKQQLWLEKQELWDEKQKLWEENQKLSLSNQELWGEKQKLAAQVTDLYRLYEQLQTQRAELAAQLETVHREAADLRWQETQLRFERDRLQQLIESMRSTRLWKLHEKLQRMKSGRGAGSS